MILGLSAVEEEPDVNSDREKPDGSGECECEVSALDPLRPPDGKM